MGYDLHITRRKHWTDEGADITSDEWLTYVRRDSEFRLQPGSGPYFAVWRGQSEPAAPWLDWSGGRIYTKHPDAALIDKMVSIARVFGATVQGDDGEIYESGGQEPRRPILPLRERFARLLVRLRPQRAPKIAHAPLPFAVGDRVRDTWGNEHTVIQIDPRAEHGMGIIRTRNDKGIEMGHMMFAHGLLPVDRRETHT